MSQLYTSGDQSVGISASASVLPMDIQGLFPLGLTGLISLWSKGLSRGFSSTAIRKHPFFGTYSILYCSTLTSTHDYWKNTPLTIWTFISKVMSLLFNALFRFVIAFLPRSKLLLISWLQSLSEVIFGAQENKICHCFHFFPHLFAMKKWYQMS